MSYKIVVDSCGELTPQMKASQKIINIPLTLQVDNREIVDDESFNQAEFLALVAASENCPKSACPSPEKYQMSCEGEEERIYIVTLSSNLSGSYNSAVLGRQLYLEEKGKKQIHVFNSRSASVGETLIALKIQECEEEGMDFEKVVETVEAYIESQNTHFVLENLETLRKNGRLTGVKAIVASALNIKPIMAATEIGTIKQIGQARGIKKALAKLVDEVVANVKNPKEKILAISHCNCQNRANDVKMMIEQKIGLKKIIILDTRGISSMYANDGGIIVVA